MAEKPFDQSEHRLSHHVKSLIERIVIEPHYATAVDTGTYMHNATQAQRFARENHRKFMGIVPHHLDWYLYGCTSRVYSQFELKYAGRRASTGQETTMELLRQRGIPTGCFHTVLEVYQHLVRSGFVLHGNAANIAHEIEARWRAADEAARAPKAPTRARKPRAARPTLAQVARGNRLGALRP